MLRIAINSFCQTNENALVLLGIVQGGVVCGDEYLPGIFTRLTDPNILKFVKNNLGLIQSKF